MKFIPLNSKYNNQKLSFRPTQSIVKECIFDALYNKYVKNLNISNIQFLDLFTGTGNISLEALKRGILNITSVDLDIDTIKNAINSKIITKNAEINIVKSDVINFLSNHKNYDRRKYNIVFADPPYNFKNWHTILSLLLKCLSETSIIILEMSCTDTIESLPKYYKLLDVKAINTTKIIFLQYKE